MDGMDGMGGMGGKRTAGQMQDLELSINQGIRDYKRL